MEKASKIHLCSLDEEPTAQKRMYKIHETNYVDLVGTMEVKKRATFSFLLWGSFVCAYPYMNQTMWNGWER